MPTADRVFLDTYVLIYGQLRDCQLFETVEQRLADYTASGSEIWISRQVLREYLAAMTRGQGLTAIPPLADVLADVQHFCRRFQIAEDGPAVTQQLIDLLTAVHCAGKQIHDANIVATMLANGITRLLTHNVQDFQRFSRHISLEPLVR
jgi:predicted nucleic acid-binding protein